MEVYADDLGRPGAGAAQPLCPTLNRELVVNIAAASRFLTLPRQLFPMPGFGSSTMLA
jgi:hypothetical protein